MQDISAIIVGPFLFVIKVLLLYFILQESFPYKLLKNLIPIYKSIRLFKLGNPKAIIETAKLENPNKTVLILGDMAELGKDELNIHCDLLNKLEGYEIFVTGKIFYECFKTQKRDKLYFFENENDFPRKILSTKLDEGINLYFKGSRSSKMERYIDIIKNA